MAVRWHGNRNYFTSRGACSTGLREAGAVSTPLYNSDPDMVRFFVSFLRTFLPLTDEQISITCNLFADHIVRQHEIEQFWLDKLELPRTSLRRSTVNTYSKYSQEKRQNKLPYGTCRVVVSKTAVIQSIYGSIQEYAGIERPEWLDAA
jgi:hypothetical protein